MDAITVRAFTTTLRRVRPPLAEIDRLRRDHDAQLAALRAEIDQLRTTVEMLMKLNT